MNKEVKKIFLVLILCSLADGFFYNFQQLWMQGNNLSIKTIGTVFSIASLLSVSVIFLCSNLITQNKIKKFLSSLVILKFLVIIILFLINHSGFNILIKFLIMLDKVIDVEIYACIYPLITLVEKDDKKYALKTILYEGFYYLSVIISTIILGKTLSIITITYNSYLLISLLFLLLAYLLLRHINLKKYYNKQEEKNDLNIMKKLFSKIKNNKTIKNYLWFNFTNNISYSCLTGMLLIILITSLNFSETTSAFLIMIFGIASSMLGYIGLKFLTFKNNYINLFIKFGIRLISYILAFISGNYILILVGLIYTRISGSIYSDIVIAPYVNMIETDYQLAFCNLSEMIAYLGISIGTFICGFTISIGLKYNFMTAALFTGIGLFFAYRALYLKNKEGE